ncbi:MAG: carboxyltransferase domain-containing protein, partial [Veillonella caviae]|nr:carboxyltransferase domain-containing protein [Veillonella caviae]
MQFGNVVAPEINRRIRQVMEYIVNQQDDAIIELVPTYCALLIQYNPLVYSYDEMCAYLTRACENFTT